MTVIEGAAKLVAKIIELEKRAERAEAALAAVPVAEIRRAMDDTTAQHFSWYGPIRRWLDSQEVAP